MAATREEGQAVSAPKRKVRKIKPYTAHRERLWKAAGFYRARVEVMQGNRMISDFMAAAGLGLTGIGVREIMTIDYKPGETVDAARVSKAMDSMIEASNRERTDFKILSYKVLLVELIADQWEPTAP